MISDFDDVDTLNMRRTITIEVPGFGDVFARCIGDSLDPLILYVHGSGVLNSSMVWNECMIDINNIIAKNNINNITNNKGY